MSRTFHHGERRVRVRGIRRKDPDLRKLARALIDIVQAEAEAEAEAIHVRGGDATDREPLAEVIQLPTKRRRRPIGPEKDAA